MNRPVVQQPLMGGTTVQVVQPAIVQPAVVLPPQPPRNITGIRRLATTQVVVGVLTAALGVVSIVKLNMEYTFATTTHAGVWVGGWILLVGLVGVCHSRNWSNRCLNNFYMILNIITMGVAGLFGLAFVVTALFFVNQSYFDDSWGYDDCVRRKMSDPYKSIDECSSLRTELPRNFGMTPLCGQVSDNKLISIKIAKRSYCSHI